jgi:hypothetical protein
MIESDDKDHQTEMPGLAKNKTGLIAYTVFLKLFSSSLPSLLHVALINQKIKSAFLLYIHLHLHVKYKHTATSNRAVILPTT